MTETKTIATTCAYCGTGCGLLVDVEDNRIVKVKGNRNAAVNEGQTCIKGAFGYHYIHSNDRLTAPLIRKEGVLTKVSWDEAISYVADKLTQIKERFGPESFSMFACERATNETNYITQKFTRAVMGTNNIDGCNRT